MVKIRMKKTEFGSPDGITIVKYEVDNNYDIPESLAESFVKQLKVAEYVEENKMEKTAPDNKAITGKQKKKEEDEKLSDSNTEQYSNNKGEVIKKKWGR